MVAPDGAKCLSWVDAVGVDLVHAAQRVAQAQVNSALVVQDAAGRIVGANKAAAEILCVSLVELLGRKSQGPLWSAISTLGLPIRSDEHPAMRTLATGEPVGGLLMGVLVSSDDRLGRLKWLDVSADPLGDPMIGVATLLTDVSGTERGIAAAQTALTAYRLASQAVSDGVIRVDAQGIVVWVSDAVVRIAGGDPYQVLGSSISSWIHPDDVAAFAQALSDGESAAPLESRWRNADGGHRWVASRVRPMGDDGTGVAGSLIGLRDIDEQVVARKTLEATALELRVTAKALADSERVFRLLADNGTESVFLVNRAGMFTWVSPATRQVLGYDTATLIGTNGADWIHPDDLPVLQSIRERVDRGEIAREEIRHRTATGEYRWMAAVTNPALDADGVVVGRMVALRDIHEQVLARQQLVDSEARYRLLAENASDVVWQVAADGTLQWVSESMKTLMGWERHQVQGRPGMDLLHPDDLQRALIDRGRVLGGDAVHGEYRILCADGSSRWMALDSHPAHGNDSVSEVVALRDIQDEVDTRMELVRAIEHDPLTGLGNRPQALSRIKRLLSELSLRNRNNSVGVLCLGVDSLMAVNEALTYAGGDRVLEIIATRIAATWQNPDLVARGSGDEFLILLPDLRRGADASVIAEKLRMAAKGTITIGRQSVEPTVSIGIATGTHDADAADLLRDAALAMRRAKENGRDRWEFFQPQLAVQAQQRLNIEAGIREGLRLGEFVPWFQPVVTLGDGALVGYEALVRWIRSDGSIVVPDEFLPIAERTNLIAEVDVAVLRQSIEQLAVLPASLHIAVNVSATTLKSVDYADMVIEALTLSGVDATRLRLEVTETALLIVTDAVGDTMRRLADVGVHWYADDFGTGYSSIANLRELPISGLKLDMSFTAGIGKGDPTSERFGKAIAGLAGGLGLDTVAEGVETSKQAAILTAQGWQHGQGYFFGRPAPITTFS